MTQIPEELLELRRVVAPAPEVSEAQREDLIARINRVAEDERLQRAKTRRLRWTLLSAAAVFLLGLGTVWQLSEPSTEVVATSEPAPALDSALSRIQLESGAVMQAEEEAQYRIEEAAPAGNVESLVFLSSGKVSLEVPPLGEKSLIVRTPHTDVVVHGTRFSVAVSAEPRSQTRVEVQEGVVSVQGQAGPLFLKAGEAWSSERLAVRTVEEAAANAAEDKPLPSPNQRVAQGSTLAAENRLYQAAMKAKRGKMPALAVQKLDELLLRFPNSPLVSAAKTERARLLKDLAEE